MGVVRKVLATAVTVVIGVTAYAVGPAPAALPAAGEVRTTGRGPRPPASGAWLGAWVQPSDQSPAGRVAALAAFADLTRAELPLAHTYQDWTDEFPGPAQREFHALGKLQMISWAGVDTRAITAGTHDALIRRRAEAIRDFGAPLLLRWRWEMDRPNLQGIVHSPKDYVAAWRHIRAIFTEVGATNAAWVWCPHVQGFVDPARDAAAYYPGDSQVDWLCADVYPGPTYERAGPQLDTFMAWADRHPRPVMIGEFGVTHPGQTGQRDDWLRQIRRYVKEHPQIKAVVYFAARQESPAYDSTFDHNTDGLYAFRAIARDPHFQAQAPPLRRTTP